MTMNRLDFLMMREDLMLQLEDIIDENVKDRDTRDGLITELCNKVCEVMDAAGLE
jgi:hypothetical protein|tara:strand:- start:519 stop:683 length:165 start_codon:yes stop_codon:yes gene_type:complete